MTTTVPPPQSSSPPAPDGSSDVAEGQRIADCAFADPHVAALLMVANSALRVGAVSIALAALSAITSRA